MITARNLLSVQKFIFNNFRKKVVRRGAIAIVGVKGEGLDFPPDRRPGTSDWRCRCRFLYLIVIRQWPVKESRTEERGPKNKIENLDS